MTDSKTFLVISDTHGQVGKAQELIEKHENELDGVIHLGDCLRDGELLKSLCSLPVLAVAGNMDGRCYLDSRECLEGPWGRVLLVHGHKEAVKSGLDRLKETARQQGFSGVAFGHTHRPLWEKEEGLWLLNPGSLSQPLGGGAGTYALLRLGPASAECSLMTLPAGPAGNGGSRPRGRLYDMLNNSDRF